MPSRTPARTLTARAAGVGGPACALLVTGLVLAGCSGADREPVDHGAATSAVAHEGELALITYLWDCLDQEPLNKPATYVLTCGDGNAALEGMSWSAWGEDVAHGEGDLVTNDCEPSCAEGQVVRFPVTVKADELLNLEATQVYSRLSVRFTDERPEGMGVDEVFEVAPEHA